MGGGGSKGNTARTAKALCKSAIKGSTGVVDQEDMVIRAFEAWDTDGNGKLNMDELVHVFRGLGFFATEAVDTQKKQISELLTDMDFNKDGSIDFQELVGYIFQAPFLQEYLKYSKKVWAEHIIARRGEEGAALAKICEKQRQQLEKELIPIIKNIYAWHDKDGSGKLDTDESVVFFANYCAIIPDLQASLLYDTASLHDAARALEKFDQWLQDNQEQKDVLNKRFQAAFSIVDVGKDGMLSENEIIQLLMHGSDRNVEVLKALQVPVVA